MNNCSQIVEIIFFVVWISRRLVRLLMLILLL